MSLQLKVWKSCFISSNFSPWRKDILANYLNTRLQALVQLQPSRLVTWTHNVFALKSAKSKSLSGENLLEKEVNCLVQQSPLFSVGGKKLLHRSNTAPLSLLMTGGKEQHSNRPNVVRKLIMHFQHLKLFWHFMTKMSCKSLHSAYPVIQFIQYVEVRILLYFYWYATTFLIHVKKFDAQSVPRVFTTNLTDL